MVLVVGDSVPVTEGLRVRMVDGMDQRGSGTIMRTTDEAGEVVSVAWDDGAEEEVPVGKDGEFFLAIAQAKSFTKFDSHVPATQQRQHMGLQRVGTIPRGSRAFDSLASGRPPSGRASGSHEQPAPTPPAPASSSGRSPSVSSAGGASTADDLSSADFSRLRSAPGPAEAKVQAINSGSPFSSPRGTGGGGGGGGGEFSRMSSAPEQPPSGQNQPTNLFSSQPRHSGATAAPSASLYSSQGQRSVSPYSSQLQSSARGSKEPTNRLAASPGPQAPPPAAAPPPQSRVVQRVSLPASRLSVDAPTAPSVGTDELHKQLLAQEVIKLRKEVQELRSGQQLRQKASVGNAQLLNSLEETIGKLSRERDETVAKANAQKGLLAKEVKALREDLAEAQATLAHNQEQQQLITYDPNSPVAQALAQRRNFEEEFTNSLRDIRTALAKTSLKELSQQSQTPVGIRTLLQMSNERIDHALNAAKSVSVEERLHIECLRIAIENGKLRKGLNEYTEGLMQSVFVKEDSAMASKEATKASRKQTVSQDGSFFGLFV